MVKSFARGHEIYLKNGKWYYLDNDEEYKDQRPCKRCGHFPTKEGHDYCLGNMEGIAAACCGHGITESYIIRGM